MTNPNIEVEPSKMSTRGQIVIPLDIREKMGLKKDTLFMVGSIDKETIIMKKVDRSRLSKEFSRIRKSILKREREFTAEEIEAEIDAVRKRR